MNAPHDLPLDPLLARSALPYELPAFDRIRPEDFAPAFDAAMTMHRAEIAAIASSSEAPTFENTLVALERAGLALHRLDALFFGLAHAHTNPVIEATRADVAPKLSAHHDAILMNSRLYARVQAVFDARASLGLDRESLRLVERTHDEFVRAGAALDASGQARLAAINSEIAVAMTTFSRNVKDGSLEGALVTDAQALDGLSPSQLAAAAAAAQERGLTDRYWLPLVNTSGHPALAALKDRSTRSELHARSLRRCAEGPNDNRSIVLRLARLRAERARLLGHPHHASWVLADETAGSVAAVDRLLNALAPAAAANARREATDLQAIVDAEGAGYTLAASDWSYYSERLRSQRYRYDSAALKPYLELERVLVDGAFWVARQLYGLSFVQRHDLPVYHPDVRTFEVFDVDGSGLALFLFDPYARDSKRGGAWMNAYVEQSTLLGAKPVVGNHLNVPKPPPGHPTLLTFDEVITLFHEFGHGLHGMLSAVRYPRFSGTSVPRDFVEFPSQVHEMWATWPEVLARYARHHETGEPIPPALVDKLLASSTFNEGFATSEYLAAALLDQAWHRLSPDEIPDDVESFERAALEHAGLALTTVPPRYRSTYFSHIFAGGYAAGYYAYIWSEVLDADGVEWFRENGGLTRENGERLRTTVLKHGGSVDPAALYRTFRGRDPNVEPLLKRRALA